MNRKRAFYSFFFGGLLPVIAFTVVEEKFGTIWGIVAGIVFGFGEIIWEWGTERKVSAMTWGGNALIIVLGAISLWSSEGIWFKLQPAIMEAVFGIVFVITVILRKPLLLLMVEKQGQVITPIMKEYFPGLTFRLGLFFLLHALLATWAAFYWSTSAWALLKGLGFTVSFILYMAIELWMMRKKSFVKEQKT